jgi:TonB family protein
MLGFILGVVIAAIPTPIPQAYATAACPRQAPRIVNAVNFTLPLGARPTRDSVRFVLDIGSDGRLRRWALAESSGDPAIDAAAAQVLPQFTFAPPSSGCVALSATVPWFWKLPAEMVTASVATPSVQAPTVVPTSSAAPASCTAPFVRLTRFGLPAHRQMPGTATVDVMLDANAHVTAVRLAHSSGKTKTDYAATIAARNASFAFVPVPGCPSGPTTYRLELTFR